jgi:hypothetical protein
VEILKAGETVSMVADLSKGKVEFNASDVTKATVMNYEI